MSPQRHPAAPSRFVHGAWWLMLLLLTLATLRAPQTLANEVPSFDPNVVDTTGTLSVDRSLISGNRDWGLLSLRGDSCVQALRVYWGRPKGPEDASAARDGCMDVAYSGGGDKVSDHVTWWPYAVDERFTPAQGLGPGMRSLYLPLLRAGSGP